MAKYLTQTMRYGLKPAVQYCRKQKTAHENHADTSAFTRDATAAYARTHNVDAKMVELGHFASNQNKPDGAVEV